MQQFQTLVFSPGGHSGYAGHIGPGLRLATSPISIGFALTAKHNWDFCGRGFGGERGWTTEGGYQRNAAIDQVGCKLGQSGIVALR